MAMASLNRVPVTLAPSHRELLEQRAKLSGLPVATLAALLLRRAIEEVGKDDGLFYRVILGMPDDPIDTQAALAASVAAIEAMERPEGQKPATDRPRAPGKASSGPKHAPKKSGAGKPRKRAAR